MLYNPPYRQLTLYIGGNEVAKRIYIYGLKLAFQTVQKYVQKYATQIKENAGEGVYAAIDLIVGLCLVVIAIIDGNSDPEGDWMGPQSVLTSSQINQIHAEVAKFDAAVGIVG